MDRLLILTDAARARAGLRAQLRGAIAGGAQQVVLREKNLPAHRRQHLASDVEKLLPCGLGTLLVADPTWSVTACHLSADAALPQPRPEIVGRSRHYGDPITDDVDYVTYSPVFPTASKPGYGPAVGLEQLAMVCAASPVPVYALGGIETPAQAAACRTAGAYGVAVMGAVMTARDPAATVTELRAALG